MYVASIIRIRYSLPTFVTSISPYHAAYAIVPGGKFSVLDEVLTVSVSTWCWRLELNYELCY